jgi:hypothetical protein
LRLVLALLCACLVIGAIWYAGYRPLHESAVMAYAASGGDSEAPLPQRALDQRSSGWLISSHRQIDGPPLIVGIDGLVFAPERVLQGADLRRAAEPALGRRYEASLAAWVSADGPLITLALLRERLEAVCGDPEDGRVILDLLTGTPASASSAMVERLRRGDMPERFSVRSFTGSADAILAGDPRSRRVRPCRGAVLRCVGVDWPSEWRMGFITVDER